MSDKNGWTCMYPPSDDEAALAGTQFDIVAVHGFLGDRVNTWTHPESGKCWLRDFLPQDFEDARVLSFGYDTGIGPKSSTSQIDDIAISLLNGLAVRRRKLKEPRPIIFIAHSLGGIIVKLALNKGYNDKQPRYNSIFASTTGIFFFGTPHQGTDLANFSSTVDAILSFVTHRPNDELLKTLKESSPLLWDINENFRHRVDNIKVVSLYEQVVPKLKKTLVVDRKSALLGWNSEDHVPVHQDHNYMCKFEDYHDDTYASVSMRLSDIFVEPVTKEKDHATASDPTNSEPQQEPLVMEPRARHIHAKFMERPDLTKQIESYFFPQQTTTTSSDTPPMVSSFLLYGLAGSGKSQLAQRYFTTRKKSFHHRFWVDASSEEMIEQDFAAIAESAQLENTSMKTVVKWLSKQKECWLLVLDDVHPDLEIQQYYPVEGHGCLLMTSLYESREANVVKEVTGFSIEQGVVFMRCIAEKNDVNGAEAAAIRELVKELGSMPLAIDIVGAYIRNNKISFKTYLDNWNRDVLNTYKKHEDATGYNRSFSKALEVTLEHISETSSASTSSHDDAIELLRFFAFLHPACASERVLELAWKFMTEQLAAQSTSKLPPQDTWMGVLTPTHSNGWQSAFERIRDALALLSRWSLLSYKGGDVPNGVFLHSLVQNWILQDLGDDGRQQWYRKVAIIVAANGTTKHSKHSEAVDLASHLHHLTRVVNLDLIFDVPWPFEDEDFKVAAICADIYTDSAYYHLARSLRTKICRNLEVNKDILLYLYSVRDLGGSCHDVGDHDAALSTYESVLSFTSLRQNRSQQFFPIASSCRSLSAQELQCLGDNDAALRRREEALQSWKSLSSRTNQYRKELLRAVRDYSSSLTDTGKYAAAIKKLQELLRIYEQSFNEDDEDFLIARSALASAYTQDGKHEEAWKEHSVVLDLRGKRNKDHPGTLVAAEKVATSLSHLGKTRDAFELRSQIMRQWQSLPSQSNHRSQNFLAAKYNLARSLEEINYQEKALELLEEVLDSYLASIQATHNKRCKLPDCRVSKRDISLAVLCCKASFLTSTNDAMECLVAMATICCNRLGNAPQAGIWYRKIVDICDIKSRLRDINASEREARRCRREALVCRNQIVSILRTEERIKTRSAILNEQARFLGEGHHDTLITKIDLGQDCCDSENRQGARKLAENVLRYKNGFQGAYPHLFDSALALYRDAMSIPKKVDCTSATPSQTPPTGIVVSNQPGPQARTPAPQYQRQIRVNRPLPNRRAGGPGRPEEFDRLFQAMMRW